MGTPSNDHAQAFWRATFDEAVAACVAEIRAFRPSVLVTYDPFGGYGHPDHIQAHRVALVAVEAAATAALYRDRGAPWRVAKVYFATFPRSAIARANALLAERGLTSPFGEATDPADIPMGVADAEVTTSLDVRAWIDTKWAALLAHRSQLGPESFFLNVPPDLRETVFGAEWYVRHRSDVPTPEPETDLFAGLV